MTNFLRRTLLAPDPDFNRMINGARLLLSVLLALALTDSFSSLAMVWAALSAALFHFSLYGFTAKEKLRQGLIITLSFTSFVFIGFQLKDYPFWMDIFLVTTVFGSFLLRRFGAAYLLYPPMLFALTLSTLMIPKAFPMSIVNSALPILLGCISSLIVALSFFPNRRLKIFFANFKRFLSQSHKVLLWQGESLSQAISATQFMKERTHWQNTLRDLHNRNQLILGSFCPENIHTQEIMQLMFIEFSISQSLAIISDSVCALLNNLELLNRLNNKYVIDDCLHAFSVFIQQLATDTNKALLKKEILSSPLEKTLEEFHLSLLSLDLNCCKEVIFLMNLYTGMMNLENYLVELLYIHE